MRYSKDKPVPKRRWRPLAALQDIAQPTAQREADAINIAGVNSVSLGGEISDLTLPARLIGEAVNHFGRLDVLVNNFKGVILLPCSNLGSYITGQQIFIDGGLTGTGPG